jgi:polyisoprenoid-binding protein YceI
MLEVGIGGSALMKDFKFWLVVVVTALTETAPLLAGETYKFDQTHSTIGFQVHHLLGTAQGQFHRFSGTIDLDRDRPENSSVTARIQVASIDTGIQKRDNHLRSPDFFNVLKFPEITFESRSVKRTGEKAGDVTGDFTMHGVQRPIVLHVELLGDPSAEHSRWKVTTAPLKRREFGLVFGGTAEAVSGIGQDVSINIQVEASRAR